MDTKLKSDIAEQAAILHALKRGFGVLRPVGDRLAYDLVFDIGGSLVRIQVKSAWCNAPTGNFVVDNRRTKTNRRSMVRSSYGKDDFDFAILYIEDRDVFYVMPIEVFSSFKSGITLVESKTRQRSPRSYQYREAWDLLRMWATQPETVERNLSNSVNPEMGIPSQARQDFWREGVETRRQASATVFSG